MGSLPPRIARFLVCTVVSVWSAHALAEATDSRSNDASRIEQRFAPQIPAEAPALPPLAPVPLPQLAPARPGTFVLSAVDIEGASVYQASDFVPLYESLLSRPIGLPQIQSVVEAITAKYRKDGYFLSRAEAPPQDLALGVLHLRVVEGFIAKVSFEGVTAEKQASLSRPAARITDERPARLATLERSLLLMQDTPGMAVKARLQIQDAAAGEFVLAIHVDFTAVGALLQLDNRGTSLVGPLEQTAAVAINGLITSNSRTRALVATTPTELRRLQYLDLSQDTGIGSNGTRFLLDGSFAVVRSPGSPAESDIKTRSVFLDATVSHPLIRSNALTITAYGKFDSETSRELQPPQAIYHDELRVLRAGATGQFADDLGGLNIITGQASQGLEILGASKPGQLDVSRISGRPDFTKLDISILRRQPLLPRWSVELAARVQRSRTPLFIAEQFGVGGAEFGRAFDPSEITGDDGEAAYIELQNTYDTPLKLLPWIQGYAFLDGGDTSFQSTGAANAQRLASAGFGLRVHIDRYYAGEVLAAFPLLRQITNGNRPKGNSIYFLISAEF